MPSSDPETTKAQAVATKRTLAWVLIGLGTLALLARLGAGSGWLWIALAAAGFLVAYKREGTYPFLVLGGILAGVAAGLLAEGTWDWQGGFLICLGFGFVVIDRTEPHRNRWPIYPAGLLIGLGLLYWLLTWEVWRSLWFPILLMALGALLLWRRGRGEWTHVADAESVPTNGGNGQPGAGDEGP